MSTQYYVYNNEALASCILLSTLSKVESLDIARACAILPCLLDDELVKFLQGHLPDVSQNSGKDNTVATSLVDLKQLVEQRKLFATFNRRYKALLPVILNSLLILQDGKQIEVGEKISLRVPGPFSSALYKLGKRFDSIEEVLPSFLSIIAPYPTPELYNILKIQL